jgi:GT2 family glycosyltransferase
MAPTVSVLIPTYNRFVALRQTLADLGAQTRPPDEIIVVDQSRDEQGRPLDRGAELADVPRLRYIYQAIPNAQKARNRAIGEARGEILILIDDDMRLPPEFVASHLRNYADDPHLDGVSGQVLLPGQQPTAELPAAMAWPANGWMFLPPNYAQRCPAINWPSCNASVRRAVAIQVGGFDENFVRTWFDDSEFSWRLHRHGARVDFDPAASAVHLQVPSGGRRPRGRNRFVWADTESWGVMFYFWRKCFGVRPVWRHVWWYVRHFLCRKALLCRPHWLAVNVYHLLAGYRWAGRRLRQPPPYLQLTAAVSPDPHPAMEPA